jgi:hypothetical protein
MLCHQPEPVSDTSIAHWRASWLPRLPSFRFEQRISGQRQTHRKGELDWRVEEIFLERVNDLMFHFVFRPNLAIMSMRTNPNAATSGRWRIDWLQTNRSA